VAVFRRGSPTRRRDPHACRRASRRVRGRPRHRPGRDAQNARFLRHSKHIPTRLRRGETTSFLLGFPLARGRLHGARRNRHQRPKMT